MKRFALAGNPNSGKTTLFNSLTGSTAHVGNWPGVTVDKRTGTYKKIEGGVNIVDLPGIYSLSPYTPEEVISRNYILDEKPDAVINVIDSTNLERNLYLTTQLLEIDVPVVIALNMIDVLEKNGETINKEKLSQLFNVPVVEVSALKETGLDELMEVTLKASNDERKGTLVIKNKDLEHLINDVKISFKSQKVENPLFHAVKLIELDDLEIKNHLDLVETVNDFKETFSDETFGSDFEAIIADARYKYITPHMKEIIVRNKSNSNETLSDKIDKVLTHKIWAFPIFIAVMFLLFHLTFAKDLIFMGSMGLTIKNEVWVNIFTGMGYEGEAISGIPSIGVFLQNWFCYGSSLIIDGITNLFALGGESVLNSWYASLILDGLLVGIDSVISFIPQILLLFLFIAILEDSGYMARVAFILDRAFKKFGLSGKAFIPMLTGFGCSVPAIMATRTLENDKEKNRTIRLITCFSCGAKAPIWALLANVSRAMGFKYADIFVFSMYLGGIVLAIVLAIFMQLFNKDEKVSPFIMELPSYHLPQARNVMAHLWDKLKHYLTKAATIIAASLVVIWFFQSFGFENGSFGMVEDMENSMIAYLGKGLKYIFYPCGWAMNNDGWKYVVCSLTGLVAKENVVGTMAVFFNGGAEANLEASITSLSMAGIYSYAFFNLLTFPCMAAISAAHSEQSKKEFVKTLLFWFFVSYFGTAILYWAIASYEINLVLGILITLVLLALVGISIVLVIRNDKKRRIA